MAPTDKKIGPPVDRTVGSGSHGRALRRGGGGRFLIVRNGSMAGGSANVFAESPAGLGATPLSFSDLLGANECAAIDEAAYGTARNWYRTADGSHAVLIDRIPVGRAIEYPVTIALVRYLRAKAVLRKLVQLGAETLDLRGVGWEWGFAADAMELRYVGNTMDELAPSRGALTPSRVERLLAAVIARGRSTPRVALVGAPSWVIPYLRAFKQSYPVHLVEPGLRALLAAATRLDTSHEWLPQRIHPEAAELPVGLTADVDRVVRHVAARLRPALAAGAAAGLEAAARVRLAVAAQDVLPAERSYLLGLIEGGCRVFTLEHGIGGSYRHQVWSIAHRLGTWGQPQAAYHQPRQPEGLQIVSVGSARMEDFWHLAQGHQRPRWDILFFEQPAPALSAGSWDSDHVRASQLLDELPGRMPGLRIARKSHPSSRRPPTVIGRASELTEDATRILPAARCVVVVTSTAGLEAMAAGIPVIQIAPRGPVGLPSFLTQSGAAAVVETAQQLEEAVRKILEDAAYRQRMVARGRDYAAEFVTGIETAGSSAKRVGRLVIEDWSQAVP